MECGLISSQQIEEVLIHASSNGGTGFKYSPRVGIKESNQTIEYYISNYDELNGAGSEVLLL